MKKKSASRSAFFNVRVLIGLFIVLAGVFLALAGLGTFSGLTASSAKAQQKHKIINIQGLPPGFDCATIHEKGIDRMEGFRAGLIMIACGEADGWFSLTLRRLLSASQKLCQPPWRMALRMSTWSPAPRPLPTLRSRRHTLRPTRITPTRFVVAFNDSRGAAAATSLAYRVSTDGGTTFTRAQPKPPVAKWPLEQTFGDPVILYNKPTEHLVYSFWLPAAADSALGAGTSRTDAGDPTELDPFLRSHQRRR